MISKKDYALFARAYAHAEHGQHRVRVGALAALRGTPIAGAWNTVRNTTTNGVHFTDHTFHAEESCLSMIPYEQRRNVSLYVSRIDKSGNLKPSFPCRFCIAQIKIRGIKYLIYWDDDLIKVKVDEITQNYQANRESRR